MTVPGIKGLDSVLNHPITADLPDTNPKDSEVLAHHFLNHLLGIGSWNIVTHFHLRFLVVMRFRGATKEKRRKRGWIVCAGNVFLVLNDTLIKTPAEALAMFAWFERSWLDAKGQIKPQGTVADYWLAPDRTYLTYPQGFDDSRLGMMQGFIAWKLLDAMSHQIHSPEIRNRCIARGWIQGQREPGEFFIQNDFAHWGIERKRYIAGRFKTPVASVPLRVAFQRAQEYLRGFPVESPHFELAFRHSGIVVYRYIGKKEGRKKPPSGWIVGGAMPHIQLYDREVKTATEALAMYALFIVPWIRSASRIDSDVADYLDVVNGRLLDPKNSVDRRFMSDLHTYIGWNIVAMRHTEIHHPEIRLRCFDVGWISREDYEQPNRAPHPTNL